MFQILLVICLVKERRLYYLDMLPFFVNKANHGHFLFFCVLLQNQTGAMYAWLPVTVESCYHISVELKGQSREGVKQVGNKRFPRL